MKKRNARIKSKITLVDEINAIENIVSAYFTDGVYTPYHSVVAQETVIITYFLDGVTIEENDDIHECIEKDKKIKELIEEVMSSDRMLKIMNFVNDKVDFIKQSAIHKNPDLDTIVEAANIIIESLGSYVNLSTSGMDKESIDLFKNVMQKLNDSDIELTYDSISDIIKQAANVNIDEEMKNVLDEKNKEIKELRKYKMLWDSRNVMTKES